MRANRLRGMLWGAVAAGWTLSPAIADPAMRSVLVHTKVPASTGEGRADLEPAPRPQGHLAVEPNARRKEPSWRSPTLTTRAAGRLNHERTDRYPVRQAAHAAPAETLPPGKPVEPAPDRISIGDPADGEVIYEGSPDDVFGDEYGSGEAYDGSGPPPRRHRRRLYAADGFHDGFQGEIHDGRGHCDYCGRDGEDECCDECCWRIRYCIDWCVFGPHLWENISLQGGVHAFKGPVDLGLNGNFGFHEGFNWAVPLGPRLGVGFQLGGQVAHSDLSGTLATGENRTQYFLTSGFFRRAPDGWGLQGGAVFDYQHDDLLVTTELAQVRAELSWVFCCRHELGAWIAAHTASDVGRRRDQSTQQPTVWRQSTDIYAGFYRHHLACGGDIRAWGGATSDGEGIIGADAEVPLCERWSLASAFNYRIPSEDTQRGDAVQESWGLTISLVWYPFRRDCRPTAPFRPLFNVADNNTFFVNQQ